MTLEKLQVGLSPVTREYSPTLITYAIRRIEDGDFGDIPDDRILESLSASINGTPHYGVYFPLVVFVRPAEDACLVISADERFDPQILEAMRGFGFNPETLQPLYQ